MPKEFDALAFDIEFALKRKLLSQALTTFFRRMPEEDLERLCQLVADHLRRSGWKREPYVLGPSHPQGPPKNER